MRVSRRASGLTGHFVSGFSCSSWHVTSILIQDKST